MTIVLVLCVGVFALAYAFYSPRNALWSLVFFSPWQGLSLDVGVSITPYLVFSASLLIVVIISMITSERKKAIVNSMGIFLLIALYVILISVLYAPFTPEATVEGGTWRSSWFRGIAQIAMFLIIVAPVMIIPCLVRKIDDLKKIGRIYLGSVFALVTIGWLQLIAWGVLGENPLPVRVVDSMFRDDVVTRSGVFMFNGDRIYRMNSFGGEPKGLGVAVAVALVIVQASIRKWTIKWLALWVYLALAMFATFSTMALLCWVGASIVQVLTAAILSGKRLMTSRKLLVGAVVTPLLTVAVMSTVFVVAPDSRIVQLVQARTVERLEMRERGVLEDFNVAVLGLLVDRPHILLTGVGLGNVHLYADRYLPESAIRYASGTVFVAKSGMLRWVSEAGLPSFAVLVMWIGWRAKRAQSYLGQVSDSSQLDVTLPSVVIAVMAFWFVAGYVVAQFFIVVGTLAAVRIVINGRDRVGHVRGDRIG